MKAEEHIEPVEVFDGTSWQAEIVKSMLENEGIHAYIKDNILGTLIPWNVAPGGAGAVKVFVAGADAEQAKLVVDEYEKNTKEN
jgi:hypothetical protein